MIPVHEDNPLQFAQPHWMLVGLAACAAMLVLFLRFDRRRNADLSKLLHPRFRQRLVSGFSPQLRALKRALWLVAVFLLFTAVSRPQMGYEWREVRRKGIDILFAVDTSRSMLAQDLTPNRLERARMGITDFVSRLEGDRVGLIPFAGSAFALCPLTQDYDAFRESLNALDTEIIPRQGTDLASAIKEAERLFDETGNNHRVLVLLTDGEDLQGDVIDAAKAAADKGMAIHTVGVGSPEGAPIPVDLGYGRTDHLRDASGQVVKTALDESTLRRIAEVTNALYVPLGRGAEGLHTIYQEKLRLVPQSERDPRIERIPLERYEWPLAAALVCLLIEFLISDRRRADRLRYPRSVASRRKSATVPSAVIALLACGFATREIGAAEAVADPRKEYNHGTEAYVAGDFTLAVDSLRASLRTPDLGLQQRSYYNLGNALYRAGQELAGKDPVSTIRSWEESIKAYADALALDPNDPDAAFNKAFVEKKLDELKRQQNQDQEKSDPQNKDEGQKQDDSQDSKDGEDKPYESKPEKQPGDGSDAREDDDKTQQGEDSNQSDKPGEQDASNNGGESKDGAEQENDEHSAEGGRPQNDHKTADREDGQQQLAGDSDESAGGQPQGDLSEERAVKREMTPEEARQLLEALREEKRTVIPIPQQPRNRFATPDNSIKGKTW